MPLLGEDSETNSRPTDAQTHIATLDDVGEFEPIVIVGMGEFIPCMQLYHN